MKQRKIKSVRRQFKPDWENGLYSITLFDTIAEDYAMFVRCGMSREKVKNMRAERMNKNRHPARNQHPKYRFGGIWV